MAFEKGKKVSIFSFLNPHCIGYCTGWFFLGSCPTALDHVRAGASIPSLYSVIADGIQAYYVWGFGDASKAKTQHAPGPMLEMLLFTTLSHDSCLSEDTETSIASRSGTTKMRTNSIQRGRVSSTKNQTCVLWCVSRILGPGTALRQRFPCLQRFLQRRPSRQRFFWKQFPNKIKTDAKCNLAASTSPALASTTKRQKQRGRNNRSIG